MTVLEGLQAADAGRNRGADPVRLLGDLEAGVLLGHAGGGDDQVREAGHAPRLLTLDEVRRIEVLHLAGEVDVEVARFEVVDRAVSSLAGEQALPARLG